MPRQKPGRPKIPATRDPIKRLDPVDRGTEETHRWGSPGEKGELVWKKIDLEKIRQDVKDSEGEGRAAYFE